MPPDLLDRIGLDNYLLSLGDFYLQQHGQQQDLQMGSTWINFGYEGDINPIHTHDALLSGVIYVKQDESVFEEMKEKDYEHLVNTFDKHFGHFVTLYR